MRISTSMRWLVVAVSAAMLLAVAAACGSETVEVPGETVVVEKEVIKEVQVPGETVVVEKEVVKTVEVPGETVVVEKEVVKTVEGPERVVVKEVLVTGEYVTDPATGKPVEKPRYGGTIVIGEHRKVDSWDPWRSLQGGPNFNFGAIYESLFGGDWAAPRDEFDFSGLYIPPKYTVGYSAESFETADPLTYIIHLRKGMRFQNKPPVNGREVTADDVKYGIDRNLGLGEFEEDGPSPHVILTAWNVLKEVEVVDKYTFKFHLKEASVLFPEAWGTDRSPFIIPREVVDTFGNDFTWEQAVGSGPWQLVDFVPGTGIFYEKHPDYYGRDEKFPENQLPYADKFQILLIEDYTTRRAAFRTGKTARDWWIGWEDAATWRETNPELQLKKQAGWCLAFAPRWDLEPYSDVRVRKAMQMAINNEELARSLYGNTADPYALMLIAPVFPDYYTPLEEFPEDVQEGYRYNPAKARELLAQAGYPDGFKQELPVQGEDDLTNLFIAYWEDIGIETEMKVMEEAVYSAYRFEKKHQIILHETCFQFNPVEIVKYLAYGDKSPGNVGNVNDPVMNKIVDDIQLEPDPAERGRLFKEANAYAHSQFFLTVSPYQTVYVAWQPWLKSYNGETGMSSWPMGAIFSRSWVDDAMRVAMSD